MRLLFIGDIVGKVGREAITTYLSRLKQTYRPTVTIVNAENAAHGKGLTEKIYKDLLREGVDFMTMGNHTYGQSQIYDFIDSANRMVRPANFPEEAPGVGMRFIQINEIKLAIINLQGRAFMQDIDDPFKKADELINEAKKETDYIFVDFHAETTSEKNAMGWYLDGRASAVVGTHTHIQTSDERILPGGTGYITDVGMTGFYDGILGINRHEVITRFITSLPQRHVVPDEGRSVLSGVIIDINKEGRTTHIERVLINDDHPF
ncbi:TIGR00282 family metallophosphoesterase [Staphylococcus saprophyticus]|uniref:TIGR00282 family metallophosphoesterase n=1 Tax=Staphylococcus saprophyticus TaxID=29385 RepID=UPI0008530567|nr:TIGR00282 family metallophosphoesterase [Staphylococcus saprophyticus]ASE59523.1 TIGR00282 family metallophosphoesterase [Staphylococcus saprophyticus]MCM3119490.1 TIGR00282 family metallophosphoesterase [Staphylococcus saprophyticus]MDW3879352.1 TIGR00282 family metallophosphoesterase [Staphylococcus saprophyticus]MDW3921739.1 TIGR00282 family metallophosphoesterase [Staphylococcus saprophyticus]MDW4019457.1 TIGR00282 family metallophosphoesterase [Staphylococcus saprophyticus]